MENTCTEEAHERWCDLQAEGRRHKGKEQTTEITSTIDVPIGFHPNRRNLISTFEGKKLIRK